MHKNLKGAIMFNKLAEKRRSIKEYTDRPVEQEKIDKIIETALRAPSGRAARPWHFVVVTDQAMREKLSAARPIGGAFVKDAAVAIVVCGDESVSGLWVEDCTIAAVTMQYAATSLGLGSRWFNIRGNECKEGVTSRDYIAGIIDLPENMDVECIIAVGYPDEEAVPYKEEELRYNQVSYGSYGKTLI
jgi:nitroreductase